MRRWRCTCTGADHTQRPAAGWVGVGCVQDKAGMEAMMDGLKKNVVMLVPQSIIMTWVTYFFSGFVLRTLGGQRARAPLC